MNRAVRTLLTYDMQITGLVGLLVGVSIILFEIFPRELVNLSQADEHDCCSGLRRIIFIIKAYKTRQRTGTILEKIADDDEDLTFRAAIEDTNNDVDAKKRIEV